MTLNSWGPMGPITNFTKSKNFDNKDISCDIRYDSVIKKSINSMFHLIKSSRCPTNMHAAERGEGKLGLRSILKLHHLGVSSSSQCMLFSSSCVR